ncbi:MAG TPA: hypothetical protein VHN79_09220 [Lacunisphaera sp.]|nr:hypothetical protein [Lacunisphaera sp.]
MIAKHLNSNRKVIKALLVGLGATTFYFLPNRDRIAFEAVEVGMPRHKLIQTLEGLDPVVTRKQDEEIRVWRDSVKFPLRTYKVTVREGKVIAKQVLP